MFLGKVVGTVWSTKKTPDLEGVRFLIVHPIDLDKEPTRNVVVVADRLGAGVGEVVMCAYGKAARTAVGNQEMSIEAAVVGIVDINQTVVSGKFAMVIVADISRAQESAAALKDRFRGQGERLGVRIYAQREDLFNAMHRI